MASKPYHDPSRNRSSAARERENALYKPPRFPSSSRDRFHGSLNRLLRCVRPKTRGRLLLASLSASSREKWSSSLFVGETVMTSRVACGVGVLAFALLIVSSA